MIIQTAFISTYPPRRCGIATFTHDLAASAGGGEVAVLHPVAAVAGHPALDHAAPGQPSAHAPQLAAARG